MPIAQGYTKYRLQVSQAIDFAGRCRAGRARRDVRQYSGTDCRPIVNRECDIGNSVICPAIPR